MAERLPPEPSPAARELLRAFRDHQSPHRRDRERGWQALQIRLDDDAPAAAANGGFYAKAVAASVGIAAAALLVLKVVSTGVAALSSQARQPAMEAPYQGADDSERGEAAVRAPRVLPGPRPEQTAGGVAAEREPQANEPAVPAEPVASPASEAAPRVRPTAGASSPAMSSTNDDLAAELALIKRATAAMHEGRHADGLAVLREHAERFPRGWMADERRVTRAELLCASGRVDEARTEARAFLREREGSALSGRMRRVCSEPKKP